MLSLILLVFALVLLVLAAMLNPANEPWRWRLGWLGLACWVASEIFVKAGVLR